jgi:hypothetical protein
MIQWEVTMAPGAKRWKNANIRMFHQRVNDSADWRNSRDIRSSSKDNPPRLGSQTSASFWLQLRPSQHHTNLPFSCRPRTANITRITRVVPGKLQRR